MKIKKLLGPTRQYGNTALHVNDKIAVENHEYIFEVFTTVSPSNARELMLEFIDDYSTIKEESLREIGFRARLLPFDIKNSIESLKLMAETLKEITVTQDEDGFAFDNYKPFLQVISDNGFCDNISAELNLIILDYATLKIRELSIEPNQHRAKLAFESVMFMQVLADGIKEIRHIPIFDK